MRGAIRPLGTDERRPTRRSEKPTKAKVGRRRKLRKPRGRARKSQHKPRKANPSRGWREFRGLARSSAGGDAARKRRSGLCDVPKCPPDVPKCPEMSTDVDECGHEAGERDVGYFQIALPLPGSPRSFQIASTFFTTSSLMRILRPHSRFTSPGHLSVASSPILAPRPETGEAKSR
jgi:hypothetical protein